MPFLFDNNGSTMNIQPSAGGKLSLEAPQQVWRGSGRDDVDNDVMQSALFAGQEMIAIKESEAPNGFGLRFLGFKSSGFRAMDTAKQAAPEFARRVLNRMADMVS